MGAVRRPMLPLAVVLAASVLTVACGDDDDTTATTTDTAATAGTGTVGNVLPPVIVDLASADGTTVTVAVGGVVDLTGGGDDVAAWSAEIADPAVVSFTPGRDDGSATFNPGLTGLAEGSSEVTLTNGAGGDTVTLTVDVTAG